MHVEGVKAMNAITRRRKRKIPWPAILFMMPAVIAFILFKYYPLFQAVFMSLFDYKLMDPPGKWVGLGNYLMLFKSSLFWTAFKNTFIFAGLYIGLTFWIPIVQALLLNEIRFGNTAIRFLYLVPTAIPSIAGYILWKWIYNPDYGLLNEWLGRIGLGPYGWLNDPSMSKVSIVLPGIVGGGIAVLLYYSALRGVPHEVVEAAKIDGAGPWQRMRKVLLPSMGFIIGIQFISFLSGVFLTFDPMFVMTGGGPVDSTRVLSMIVYDNAFEQYRFGIAGAVSFIMFAIIALVTFAQLKLSSSREGG